MLRFLKKSNFLYLELNITLALFIISSILYPIGFLVKASSRIRNCRFCRISQGRISSPSLDIDDPMAGKYVRWYLINRCARKEQSLVCTHVHVHMWMCGWVCVVTPWHYTSVITHKNKSFSSHRYKKKKKICFS